MSGIGKPRVVIVGSGFAGLEAAFSLRDRVGDAAEIELISESAEFVYKPSTVYIPFGFDPERVRVPIEKPLAKRNILFVRSAVTRVDLEHHTVRADGQTIGYDYLLLATGARMRPAEVPGLAQYGRSIWTPAGMIELREAFGSLLRADQEQQRVLFLVPPHNKWSGPLYELAFLLDGFLRFHGARDKAELAWATYEKTYFEAFGPRLDRLVEEQFEIRDIAGRRELNVAGIEPGLAVFSNGERTPFDLLISFPPYVAASAFPGLPMDERGFLRTEPHTCQVTGHPEIYAIGDGADFPIKQAHIALLQADAAAEHVASTMLGTTPRFGFEPVTRAVIDRFDTATFVQAPMRATGDEARPFEVAVDDKGYLVGDSPAWQAGKKAMNAYVPWRLRAGQPVHEGASWTGMHTGMELLTRLLAR
jgi:NADH dehydrogenase FAD-containing subunit